MLLCHTSPLCFFTWMYCQQSSDPAINIGIYADQVKPKLPRLPAFADGKDDLDSWLLRFERFPNTSGWPKENWCTFLSVLLTGRALEVFCCLSQSEAIDYDRVKEVLQKKYNPRKDGHRQKVCACTADGENPNMFIVRLKTHLERWMKMSDTPQTYDRLRDLCIRGHFLDASPVDLSTYLRERRKFPTLDEVAQSADLFLTARKRQLSDSVNPVTSNSQSKTTAKKLEVPTCYICKRQGHRAGECRSNNVTK